VKGKARQYASEFGSTPLPIPKEIRTSTPVNNNRQPGAGDVSPSDAAAVCQLGSITTGESLAKFNEFRAGDSYNGYKSVSLALYVLKYCPEFALT
jgi:hypothetical protein